MSKSQKRKAKSAKKVTFASSPVYIPRNKSPSGYKISAPKKVKSDSILFGQISVQIPLNSGSSTALRFGSSARSVHPCSSEVSNFKIPCRLETAPKIVGSSHGRSVKSVVVCSKCLSPGHLARYCLNRTCCKVCYNYGHLS